MAKKTKVTKARSWSPRRSNQIVGDTAKTGRSSWSGFDVEKAIKNGRILFFKERVLNVPASRQEARSVQTGVAKEASPGKNFPHGEQNPPAKRYLSVKQVVQRLNHAVSGKLIYKLVATGKLKANKTTGKVLVEEDSLAELMEGTRSAGQVPQVAPPPKRPRGQPRGGAKGSGKKRIELW